MDDVIGRVHHATHEQLAARLVATGTLVDALIVDPPYSARTHAATATLAALGRSDLAYASWSEEDVSRFVATWSPLVRGWCVVMTDHVLAGAWTAALAATGRYVFAPLPLVETGSRVRLAGDGPSSWTCWVVVARPRSLARWGTLPGAYVVRPERGREVVGGKPLAAMRAIVADYSRPGEVVCDPCCGAGTTLVAAHATGRRWVGGDADAEHAAIARRRMERVSRQVLLDLDTTTRAERERMECA